MSVTITLKYPVSFQGTTYDKITLRRPRVKDTELLVDSKENAVRTNNNYLGQLAQLPPGVFAELDLADMRAVQKALESFSEAADAS